MMEGSCKCVRRTLLLVLTYHCGPDRDHMLGIGGPIRDIDWVDQKHLGRALIMSTGDSAYRCEGT
ncbi:hypothetical protein BKA93DRAFT_770678 [Sparassis latifolia]